MFHRIISSILIMTFALTSVVPPSSAQVLTGDRPLLITDPLGSVPVSVFSGIKIYPQEPFRFDFIMSEDNSSVGVAPRGYPTTGEHRGSPLQDESMKLIKYFMASLTVPEGDLWVNLSPYEPDRIVPKSLGQTEMGRDLLAQDYILKQLTASLMSPEGESGKKFWEKVYDRLYEAVGAHGRAPVQNDGDDMQNAIESFNKVWIVPNKVEVYQNNDVAYIVNADFKVMLESDYVAEQAERNSPQPPLYIKRGSVQRGGVTGNTASADDVKNIIRSIIIPLIENEVNHGESFANLRQIFHSMILAKWYEQHFKNSVLGQSYIDQNVVEGIKLESVGAHSRAPVQVQDIYNQYVAAFKSGAADIIKEEYDPVMQTVVPRKYFTGGVGLKFEAPEKASVAQAMLDVNKPGRVISFDLAMMDADKNLNLPNLDFSGEKAASARELIGTFHLEDLKVIDKKSFGDDLEIYTVEAPPIRDDMVIFEVPEIFRELVDRQYWENFKNQFSVDLVYRRQGDAVELIGILPNPESLSDIEGAEKDGFYYYDLSSYYVPYSVLREVTYKALLRWQEQARLILERQEALQAYLQADSSISLQSIAQKYKQQSPFYTLKFDVDADDELEVKPFLIQNVLDEDSEEAKFFEFEPEYQKAVLLNFLTVYSPYDEDNSIADKESNLTAMQRADEFDFQPGDRYLDHATGSGLVASIVVLVLKLRGLMVPVTVKDMNPLAEANALANVEHILGAKVDFNEDQMFAFVTSNAPHIGGWISPKYFWKYLLLDQMGQDELKYQMMDDDLKFLSRADELNYDFQDLYDGGISGSMYWIHFMMYLRHHLQPGKGEAVMWNQSDFMLEDPVWNPVFQQFKIYTSGRAGLRKSSFVLLLTGLVENWNWSDRQFNEYEFFYWISGEEGDQEEYVSDLKSGGKSLASKIIDGEVKVFLNAQGQNVSLEEFLRGIGNETEIILSDSPQGLTARLVEDNAMLDVGDEKLNQLLENKIGQRMQFSGQRQVDFYPEKEFPWWSRITERDRQKIKIAMTTNDSKARIYKNTGTTLITLEKPIMNDWDENDRGEDIYYIQLKRVNLDENEEFVFHEGGGFVPSRYDADGEGRATVTPNGRDPQGGMVLPHAANEFLVSYDIKEKLKGKKYFRVKTPLGIGVFPDAKEFNGQKIGFVALGLTKSQKQRWIVSHLKGYKYSVPFDSKETIETFRVTGWMLRVYHDLGYFRLFAHPGNVSIPYPDIDLLPSSHDLDGVKAAAWNSYPDVQKLAFRLVDLSFMFRLINRDSSWSKEVAAASLKALLNGYFGSTTNVDRVIEEAVSIRNLLELTSVPVIDLGFAILPLLQQAAREGDSGAAYREMNIRLEQRPLARILTDRMETIIQKEFPEFFEYTQEFRINPIIIIYKLIAYYLEYKDLTLAIHKFFEKDYDDLMDHLLDKGTYREPAMPAQDALRFLTEQFSKILYFSMDTFNQPNSLVQTIGEIAPYFSRKDNAMMQMPSESKLSGEETLTRQKMAVRFLGHGNVDLNKMIDSVQTDIRSLILGGLVNREEFKAADWHDLRDEYGLQFSLLKSNILKDGSIFGSIWNDYLQAFDALIAAMDHFSDLAARQEAEAKKSSNYLVLKKEIQQIKMLRQSLFRNFVQGTPMKQTVRVRDVIEDGIQKIHRDFRGSVESMEEFIEWDIPPDVMIDVDPDSTARAVAENLSNHFGYYRDGLLTKVKIAARKDLATGEVVIEILDNGKGFPEPLMEFDSATGLQKALLLDVSTRVHGGLGLAFFQRVMGDHGAKIEISNDGLDRADGQRGKGAKFTIRVPKGVNDVMMQAPADDVLDEKEWDRLEASPKLIIWDWNKTIAQYGHDFNSYFRNWNEPWVKYVLKNHPELFNDHEDLRKWAQNYKHNFLMESSDQDGDREETFWSLTKSYRESKKSPEFESFKKDYLFKWFAENPDAYLFPVWREFLKFKGKKKDCKMMIVTREGGDSVRKMLKALGLDDVFDKVISAEEEDKSKGEIFQELVKDYDPEDVLAIGDKWDDELLAAIALKLNVLPVFKGGADENILKWYAQNGGEYFLGGMERDPLKVRLSEDGRRFDVFVQKPEAQDSWVSMVAPIRRLTIWAIKKSGLHLPSLLKEKSHTFEMDARDIKWFWKKKDVSEKEARDALGRHRIKIENIEVLNGYVTALTIAIPRSVYGDFAPPKQKRIGIKEPLARPKLVIWEYAAIARRLYKDADLEKWKAPMIYTLNTLWGKKALIKKALKFDDNPFGLQQTLSLDADGVQEYENRLLYFKNQSFWRDDMLDEGINFYKRKWYFNHQEQLFFGDILRTLRGMRYSMGNIKMVIAAKPDEKKVIAEQLKALYLDRVFEIVEEGAVGQFIAGQKKSDVLMIGASEAKLGFADQEGIKYLSLKDGRLANGKLLDIKFSALSGAFELREKDNAMLDGQQDESPEEKKLRALKKLHSVLLISVGWELKGPLLLLSGWALWSYVQGDFVSFDILSVFSFIMLIACVASQYHASENIKSKKILEDYMTEQAEELKRKKEWEDGTRGDGDKAMLQTSSAPSAAASNDTTAVLEYESIVKYQQHVTEVDLNNWRAPMVHFVLANPKHFALEDALRSKAESFDDNPFLLEAKNTGGLKDAEVNAIVQMYWDYEGQGKIIPIVSKMLFGVYRQDWYRDHAEQLFDLELLKEFVLKNNILGQKRIIVTRTSPKIVAAQMEALGFGDVFEIVEARNDKAMLGAEVALFLKAMSTSTIWGAGDYLTQMYVRKQKSFDKYAMIRSALLGFVYAFFVHFEYSALNAWVSSPLAQAAIYLSIIGILNDMGLYSLSQALQKEEAKWWGENGFWDNFKKSFWIIYIYWTPIVLANIYWVPLDYVVYVSTAAAFLYKPVSLSIYRGLNLRKTLLIKNIGKKAGFEKLTKSQMGYLESFTFAELKILFADSPERLYSRIRFAMPPDRFAAKIRRIKKAFYSDYHFRFDQLDWKVMETEEEWRFLNTLARKKNHGAIDVLRSFLVHYKDISADEFQGYFKKMWVIWKFSHGSQYFFSKAVESQYLPAIFSIVEVLARAGYRGVGGINNPKVSAVFSKYVQLLKKYKPEDVVEDGASKEFLQEVIVSLADIIHRDGIEVFLEIFALVLEEKITNNNEFERNLTEARSKQNSNAAPGGIDLNNLNMQTSGQVAPIQMNSDPAMMNVPINGLVPQIIHIGTMNVGQFLGLNDAPQDDAPESLTFMLDLKAIREET